MVGKGVLLGVIFHVASIQDVLPLSEATIAYVSAVHMAPDEAVSAHQVLAAKTASPSTTEPSNWQRTSSTHRRKSSSLVRRMTSRFWFSRTANLQISHDDRQALARHSQHRREFT